MYIMLAPHFLLVSLWQVQCVMFLLLMAKCLLLDVGHHCLFELPEIIQFFVMHSIFKAETFFS